MAIKINYDSNRKPINPTLVLAKKSGEKLGAIPSYQNVLKADLESGYDLNFKVSKYIRGTNTVNPIWNDIRDFRLVYCPEWNIWFELDIDLSESSETIKNASCKSLGEAELSQIMIFDTHFNDETFIKSTDFDIIESEHGNGKLILHDPDDLSRSMIYRLLKDKAPHYHIGHIDNSLIDITKKSLKEFVFDNKSLYDCLWEICKELDATLIIDSSTVTDDVERAGEISRTINIYDNQSYCYDCGYRGNYKNTCPHCNHNPSHIFVPNEMGKDTGIFISTKNLTDNIEYKTDNDSVKNCFRLEAGDDLMTSTIINCNPNGSQYLWFITDEAKEDMSSELVEALNAYDEKYEEYSTDLIDLSEEPLMTSYIQLVTKYNNYISNIEERIPVPTGQCWGYSSLMELYYNTLTLESFIRSEMMPVVEPSKIIKNITCEEAAEQIYQNLNNQTLYARTYNEAHLSETNVTSIVLNEVKLNASTKYKIEAKDVTFSQSSQQSNAGTWYGTIVVSSYYDDDEDSAETSLTINISENSAKYYKNYIETKLKNKDIDNYGVVALFRMNNTDFTTEIDKYGLNPLVAFSDGSQAAIAAMQELQVNNVDNITFLNEIAVILSDYKAKLNIIEQKISEREQDLKTIVGSWAAGVPDNEKINYPVRYRDNSNIISMGIQMIIDDTRLDIQDDLDLKKWLDDNDCFAEFCSFRREDTYQNDNYISTGLNDAELFNNARAFFNIAQRELYKSAMLQHSISANLYDLLVLPEFEPLIENFELGNWLRLEADEKISKLRLLSYEINFDDLDYLDVNFSDVQRTFDGYIDLESLMSNVKTMSTSYNTVSRQAENGNDTNKVVDGWFRDSLSLTQLRIANDSQNQNQQWSDSGMFFRRSISQIDNTVQDDFDQEQLKILNNAIVFTDDNWGTIKTAIGKVTYINPTSGQTETGYGIIADHIIGKFILGENLTIANVGNTLTIDKNGLVISNINTSTNTTNTVTINPNDNSSIFKISRSVGGIPENVFIVDSNGNGTFTGTINAEYGSIGGWSILPTRIENDRTSTGGYRCGIQSIDGSSASVFFAGCSTAAGGTIIGQSNFYVRNDGFLYATNGSFTGSITLGGQLSSTRGNNSVTFRGVQPTVSDAVFFVRYNGTYPFYVGGDGKLIATNADIKGSVNATNLSAQNNYYIYDTDYNEKVKIITEASDGSSDTSYRFGRLTNNGFGSGLNYISFHDVSQDKYCEIHSDYLDLNCPIVMNSHSIQDNNNIIFKSNVSGTVHTLYYTTGGNLRLNKDDDGQLGTSDYHWSKIYCKDSTIHTSDRKRKDNIEEITFAEDLIMNLTPVTFMWKNGDHRRKRMSFIAQDAAQVCKDINQNLAFVTASYKAKEGEETPEKEYYGEDVDDELLNWGMLSEELIAPIVSVIQNQQRKITELETAVNELKGE